jgi:hypothetical protein
VNAWIFVPNSLDINSENYGKDQFYRDIKSNVRLITPVFTLAEIAKDDSIPMRSLKGVMNSLVASYDDSLFEEYEYHLKMFAAIFKSALREQASFLMKSCNLPYASTLVGEYAEQTSTVLAKFRGLYELISDPDLPEKVRTSFRMCDEFMTHVLDVRTIKIIKQMDSLSNTQDSVQARRQKLTALLVNEHSYRKEVGYSQLTGSSKADRRLVHHYGMLKKYIESELYIRLYKKKDGVAVQQIYYSLAAGVAMVFATAVSWNSQVKYGSVTWPLFVALVISYMLKDRIKDLLRYYFAHKLGNKYYDKKALITIGKTKVGSLKEGVDFISYAKLPSEVKELREKSSFVDDESRIFDEKILLYRQRVTLDEKSMSQKDQYSREGVNEILRLHLNRFTQKMDNPQMVVDTMDDDGNILTLNVQKIYYLNLVFKLVHDGQSYFKQFRIGMTREGVKEIEQIKNI